MRWIGEPDVAAEGAVGVAERRFEATLDGRTVPGVLWLPPGNHPRSRPLVLIGHGATLHKRVDYIVYLAQLLTERGFAAAALDAPGHGDRRTDPAADEVQLFANFLAEWSRPGSTDDVVAEWHATLSALRDLDEVGDGPLGFWGLSMGTIYGVPYVASEPRVQVAVFGLMGLLGPTKDRMAADAAAISCPVLFIQQWHDQLVPREDSFRLFDALGPLDKRLHAHPGEHAAVPVEEIVFSARFLERHLAAHGGAGDE
jgi:alpha-beta hydrolase superfamily lysophospholipase